MLLSILFAYALPVGMPVNYGVDVTFEGYLPLLGGKDGKAEVHLEVRVQGLSPDLMGRPRASSEIADVKIKLNGADLPITVKSIQSFFPKTTISMSPLGKVISSDAPNVSLPVRLPGLDVKRFPDITYLPFEFPAAGIEEGSEFSFRKAFGESDVEYRVKPSAISSDHVSFDLNVAQKFSSYEDSRRNPVPDGKGAAAKVDTEVSGKGHAVFDRDPNLLRELDIDGVSSGTAVNLATNETTTRKLKTHLHVFRKPNAASSATISWAQRCPAPVTK